MKTIGLLFLAVSVGVFASPIRVSLPPLLGALPVAVAQKLDLFREQGLEVQLVPLPSQRDRILAFQAGQIEAMVTDLTSALLLVASQPKQAAIAAALYLPPQDGTHLALITPVNFSRIQNSFGPHGRCGPPENSNRRPPPVRPGIHAGSTLPKPGLFPPL
jgi:hypothetical protein